MNVRRKHEKITIQFVPAVNKKYYMLKKHEERIYHIFTSRF